MKFFTFPFRLLRWMMLTRPIRFTRFGTFYVLFSIGVGAAAINTGNNLLYLILGMLLGFIVISGFLSDSSLWGIETTWHPTGSLYVGRQAAFECRTRKGWFPGVAISIESRWQGLPAVSAFASWIPAKGNVTIPFVVTPLRRGYLTLESCHYSTRFPFGLFQKSHTWAMHDKWLVYPRAERLSGVFFEREGKEVSQHAASHVGLGSVPLMLRDYRSGDALRQVHWKASAKRQRFIVKETEEEANEGDLFVLNAWPRGLTESEMENLISFIASLIFTASLRGRPFGLATPECLFKPEYSRLQVQRIFEYLALVRPSDPQTSLTPPLRPKENHRRMDILSLWKARAHA